VALKEIKICSLHKFECVDKQGMLCGRFDWCKWRSRRSIKRKEYVFQETGSSVNIKGSESERKSIDGLYLECLGICK